MVLVLIKLGQALEGTHPWVPSICDSSLAVEQPPNTGGVLLICSEAFRALPLN